MSSFDYGNARLRAMKSRLLVRRELDALTESGSLNGLIAALSKTAYRRSVEAALARCTGMACVDEFLRSELIASLGSLLRFYEGEAHEQVQILLRTYDIHNLKVILNGLSKNVPTNEILSGLIPIGALDYSILTILANEHSPRDAIDLLASMSLTPAQPLLKLRAEHPGADVFEMELVLDQWHYQEAKQQVKGNGASGDLLAAALDLDADITNILTVLRFVHVPLERDLLRERLGSEAVEQLFVGPGQISFDVLLEAEKQETVEGAIDKFSGTSYIEALRSGLGMYARTSRLSHIERRLRRYRLDWKSRLIAKDPLGLGVILGFIALKINEVNSVRWIARAMDLSIKPELIRSELDFVA
jgi:V/A-type H+/Na+-transporting ATPase subunit C